MERGMQEELEVFGRNVKLRKATMACEGGVKSREKLGTLNKYCWKL